MLFLMYAGFTVTMYVIFNVHRLLCMLFKIYAGYSVCCFYSTQVTLYVILVWMIAAATSVPPLLGWNDLSQNYIIDNVTSSAQCILFHTPSYVIYSACVSFFIPFVLTFFLYVQIFVELRRLRGMHAVRGKCLPWLDPVTKVSDMGTIIKSGTGDEGTGIKHKTTNIQNTANTTKSGIHLNTQTDTRLALSRVTNLLPDSLRVASPDRDSRHEEMNSSVNMSRWTSAVISRSDVNSSTDDNIAEMTNTRQNVQYERTPGCHLSYSLGVSRESSLLPTLANGTSLLARINGQANESEVLSADPAADRLTVNNLYSIDPPTQLLSISHVSSQDRSINGEHETRLDEQSVMEYAAGSVPYGAPNLKVNSKHKVNMPRYCNKRLTSPRTRVHGSRSDYGQKVRRDRGSSRSEKREMRATMRMAAIIGVFFVMWVGFFTVYVANGVCVTCYVPPSLETFFFWLGYANSTVNPILYTIFNDEFRKAFLKMLCCYKSKVRGGRSRRR